MLVIITITKYRSHHFLPGMLWVSGSITAVFEKRFQIKDQGINNGR